MTTWNVNLIPFSDREQIKTWYAENKAKELMRYHNVNRLSGDLDCCDKEKIMYNFKIIIDGWK